MRRYAWLAAACFFFALIGCGGSNHSTQPGNNPITGAANNVVPITAGGGPAGIANGVFTNVTVCSPGSASNCATVGGILVDTGSTGLRILSSVLPAGFTLPKQTATTGSPVGECFQFLDGFTWGPVETADVHLSGESASSIPIQIVADPSFPGIPASCASTGTPEQDVASLGANGILGVSNFVQDCGPACTVAGAGNPGLYYSCPAGGCTQIAQALAQQVVHPVSAFATDNNGVIVELPAVSTSGAVNTSGSLVFGIGTQSNNGLAGASVLMVDSIGNITSVFKSQSFPKSFIDSGSNGLFFLDATTTGIPACTDNPFYCPSSTQNLTAVNQGTNGTSTSISFSVANADQLFSPSNPNFLFSNLGAPNPGIFDWGLPFFFGRNVFTAIEGKSTPGGTGPYVAY